MAALPYMQLYVADYLADTSHLSTLEHGVYLLLIMNYWQRGKPLPAGDEKVARIARITTEEWLAVKDNILPFFTEKDGQLIHHRIERDLASVLEKSEQASAAGRSSAAKRYGNGRSTDVQRTFNHTDTDTDTEADQTQKPPASKPEALALHQQAYIPLFKQLTATLGEADLAPTSRRLAVLNTAMHDATVGGFERILEAANNLARAPGKEAIRRYDWLLNRFDYAEHITEYLTAKNNSKPRPRKYATVPEDWRPDATSHAT